MSKIEISSSLFMTGTTEVETIAEISAAEPRYVGSVLPQAGSINNHFDV